MADLISRAAAIDAIVSITPFLDVDSIKSIYNIGNGEEWVDGVYDAINAVEEVNAVDAVPVIRCRDCCFGVLTKNSSDEDIVICENPDSPAVEQISIMPDWFCADGERRDSE